MTPVFYKKRSQDQEVKKKRRNSSVSGLSIGADLMIEALIAKKNEDRTAKRIPLCARNPENRFLVALASLLLQSAALFSL
jgi:hypothetical protein